MSLTAKEHKNIVGKLTGSDLVRSINYSLFPRQGMVLQKLSIVNKVIIFSSGDSSEYDVRSIKELDSVGRYIRAGAQPITIIVPILTRKTNEKTGKVYQVLNGFRGTSLFSTSDNSTYGEPVEVPDEPTRYIDFKALSERFGIDLLDLEPRYEIYSYYNESDCDFVIAEEYLKRFIYTLCKRVVKEARFKHQMARDAIVVELLTLAILRSIGRVVSTDIDYQKRLSDLANAQRTSVLGNMLATLNGIGKCWDLLDLPIVEGE